MHCLGLFERYNSIEDILKAVSDTVWVCWKAMITEKTIKEECTNKNYFNDNYSYIAHSVRFENLPIMKNQKILPSNRLDDKRPE